VGSGLHLAFLYHWINLYGIDLKPVSANHYNRLAGAGPRPPKPLILLTNKNDNPLKTNKTIFTLPLDF
jgi:hypothetical protein